MKQFGHAGPLKLTAAGVVGGCTTAGAAATALNNAPKKPRLRTTAAPPASRLRPLALLTQRTNLIDRLAHAITSRWRRQARIPITRRLRRESNIALAPAEHRRPRALQLL